MEQRDRQDRNWSSIPGAKQRGIGVAAFVQFALLGIALRDWRKRPGSQMRGGSKWKWFPVLFVNVVGPIIYLVWGRR